MPTLPLMNAASLQPGTDVYHRYDVKRPVRREDCLSLHAKDRSFILCETELLFCQEAVKKLSEMYSANGETMNTASLARRNGPSAASTARSRSRSPRNLCPWTPPLKFTPRCPLNCFVIHDVPLRNLFTFCQAENTCPQDENA